MQNTSDKYTRMTNKDIAKKFQLLGKIMELHGENPFKIRSYTNAYRTLRKWQEPLAGMSEEEISQIKGVGKAISAKIRELVETGEMKTLQKYLDKTPEGVVEMLQISGFGPKKVKTVWEELGVETIGELLYAVNENRLIELKGFGKKTQEDLRQKLEYYMRSRHQFHYASLETEAFEVLQHLQQQLPAARIALTGACRRQATTLTQIDVLIDQESLPASCFGESLQRIEEKEDGWQAQSAQGFPVFIHRAKAASFGTKLFQTTGHDNFLQAFRETYPQVNIEGQENEEAIFAQAEIPVIAPVLRESDHGITVAKAGQLNDLITEDHIQGVVHSHSTYSDGLNTLREMAEYSREQGYQYLVITDHSKSAFYANGLQPDRVWQQMEEIDALNEALAPFRIFKGIESDILSNGALDYEEDVLKAFEVVIASIHSNLRMDEAKATQRLITAIENPYTTMLGHPTGRLLLSRKGYPIDHKKIIDACAENGVCIELNANPYRLDLDWSWIPYALEKDVDISINPDAHSTSGIHDIHYGVIAARKGGLTVDKCLNAKDLEAFSNWLTSR